MIKTYRDPSDCWIRRDDPERPDRAVLMDCDGYVVHDFPADWTDDQVMAALAFANKAYQVGYECGGSMKARDIRRALEVA